MKTKNALIILMLLVVTVTFGQPKLSKDFDITLGTPYRVVDAWSKYYFSEGKGFTIAVKIGKQKATIQRYDVTNMREVNRREYQDFPPDSEDQGVIQLGDKLFYIFSSVNKKEKNEDLYSREINMNDGTLAESKLLFSTTAKPLWYGIHKSFDNTKLLIDYRLKPTVRNDSKSFDVIGFYVFNPNLEKQWGGEVKMPYTEKDMNNLAYGVSKEGKAYMLAYNNVAKRTELLTISNDLNPKVTTLDIDGKYFFQVLHLDESADGNLSCTGYYANGLDFKIGGMSYNTNGILSFKMNLNGKVLSKYDFEFPIDLINQYESKREQDKNEKREEAGKAGIRDLTLRDLKLNPDGSTTVIGEQHYTDKKYVYGRGLVSVYVYGDIIATKFDANGKLLWMKKLPKTQKGDNGRGGMSIRCITGKDASYVLYLDNVKNADININEVPATHVDGKGGYLTTYKIDGATGEIEKHYIANVDDIKGTEVFQFKTSRIFDISDKVFMLEIYIKGKEDNMIKFELTQ